MKGKANVFIDRYGFYPRGGGKIRAEIEPNKLNEVSLLERGPASLLVKSIVAGLPRQIAEREVDTVRKFLGRSEMQEEIIDLSGSSGPGNILFIEIESKNATEIITGFGERGVGAEVVAQNAAREAQTYLDSDAPIGLHLADQLLLPLALAGGGEFLATGWTDHSATNLRIINKFIEMASSIREIKGNVFVKIKRK